METIKYMGLFGDNGKPNGNYYGIVGYILGELGFRA